MTATVPRVSSFNIICLENSLCSYPGLSSGDLVVISGYSITSGDTTAWDGLGILDG